jgi:hypothetical protein
MRGYFDTLTARAAAPLPAVAAVPFANPFDIVAEAEAEPALAPAPVTRPPAPAIPILSAEPTEEAASPAIEPPKLVHMVRETAETIHRFETREVMERSAPVRAPIAPALEPPRVARVQETRPAIEDHRPEPQAPIEPQTIADRFMETVLQYVPVTEVPPHARQPAVSEANAAITPAVALSPEVPRRLTPMRETFEAPARPEPPRGGVTIGSIQIEVTPPPKPVPAPPVTRIVRNVTGGPRPAASNGMRSGLRFGLGQI